MCTGYFLKKSNVFRSVWVPFQLLTISLLLAPLVLEGNVKAIIINAITITSLAVFGHQLISQGRKSIKKGLDPTMEMDNLKLKIQFTRIKKLKRQYFCYNHIFFFEKNN